MNLILCQYSYGKLKRELYSSANCYERIIPQKISSTYIKRLFLQPIQNVLPNADVKELWILCHDGHGFAVGVHINRLKRDAVNQDLPFGWLVKALQQAENR